MTEIAIVRAAHLHVYLDELRETGVHVESALGSSRLPSWVEETPDAYVSIPLCLDWIARRSRDVELMDFGFRAAQRGSLATLSQPLQRALAQAPTGFARMGALLRLASLDDNVLAIRSQPEGNRLRVICDLRGLAGNPYVCLAEWLTLQAVVSIVRSVAGPRWRPAELTFVARQAPSAASQEAFPDTRILVRQALTSVLVDRDVLARPCPAVGPRPDPSALACETAGTDPSFGWSFTTALQAAIRPYLGDGYPDIGLLAEVVGLSRRTLQRRLQLSGRTYSDVVRDARFELARELLADPSARIIDVSMAAGYQSPQHFARAFRQVAGVSPTAYRGSGVAAG